ncbi:hypothetical protein RvVAR0630_pl03710 (plasmid) [Agrobacterium vitis]|nr:hypothetical protein RvVAR0630_pl03710 [Agrobacterium vitis]
MPSFAHPIYKNKILCSKADDTKITDAFSIGWHTHKHRVIRNRTCDKTLPSTTIGTATYFGRDFPIPRYSVAVPTEATKGAIEEMALYAGVACDHITEIKAAREIIASFEEVLSRSNIQ